MIKTNNKSANSLDNWGQAQLSRLSIGSCFILSLKRLSCFVTWMIKIL